MKRKLAWMVAIVSGVYVVLGPLPDPIPLLDEGLALMVFVKAMGWLGYDVTRWLPFVGKGARRACPDNSKPCPDNVRASGQTIDV